jgi:hypothetical protein
MGRWIRNSALAALLGLAGALMQAQVSAGAADLHDTLLAKATALYDSTAKSGLRGFDCQVHPDWKLIMASSRKGAAGADDEPRLALVSTARLTLHARMAGGSTLDWQAPGGGGRPLNDSDRDLLERAHRGIENTLLGVLKLWMPLVDGSVAEGLGEEGMTITPTGAGDTVRSPAGSKEKWLTEEFDRDLLLVRYVAVDAGATVDIVPHFQPGPSGLQLADFTAHIKPASGGPASTQEMHVEVEYQAASGEQIPAAVNIDVPDVVTMNFKLDGCVVNPPH